MRYCFGLFFLILFINNRVSAQECTKVWLNGSVKDTSIQNGFYNLMVINRTSGKGIFGQPNGNFAVYVKQNDSINLSVKGYYVIGFRVKPDSLCQFHIEVPLSQIPSELAEVIVKPLKTIQQIKEERAALALRETRTITGMEAFQSPITALYQRFSKKEQSKKKVAEMEFRDSKIRVVQELLRLYVAYDIVQLSEEQFDSFIAFLNLDEDFLKTASDIELITFIQDKFEHYKRLIKRD